MSDINLIPVKRLLAKGRQRKMQHWIRVVTAYVTCLGLTLGSAYAVWAGDDTTLAQKLTDTETRMDRTQESIIKLRKQLALCRSQLQANQTIEYQPDWSRLLLLIGEALGDEVALQTCQLNTLNDQKQSVVETTRAAESAAPTDTLLLNRNYHLKLAGFSRTQTALSLFVLRLERLDLFKTVRLDKAKRLSFLGEPAVTFTIECEI